MLGELYVPKRAAFETASAVLKTENVYACNVALGCPNDCTYCYGPLATRRSRADWLDMKLPKRKPCELVQEQLTKISMKYPLRFLNTEGFFLSFLTDPFHPLNQQNTNDLITFLMSGSSHHRLATLSKLGIADVEYAGVRAGVSIASLDEDFRKMFEPNTALLKARLRMLCVANQRGYSWVSLEPYPCSEIWKQPLEPLLEELKFWGINLIVFGKWNYDSRARTERARIEYAEDIRIVTDFCKSNNIGLHIKSETMKFAFPEPCKE